jgi:hypothetical protein
LAKHQELTVRKSNIQLDLEERCHQETNHFGIELIGVEYLTEDMY